MMQSDDDWISSKPLFKELWKFNTFTSKWTKIQMHGQVPSQLASHTASLVDIPGQTPKLMVYGGTGTPYGVITSYIVFMLGKRRRIATIGHLFYFNFGLPTAVSRYQANGKLLLFKKDSYQASLGLFWPFLSTIVHFLKMSQSWPLFVYFCYFLDTISIIQIEIKLRWCAWESNPGPQDCRRRRSHGAMAATPQR